MIKKIKSWLRLTVGPAQYLWGDFLRIYSPHSSGCCGSVDMIIFGVLIQGNRCEEISSYFYFSDAPDVHLSLQTDLRSSDKRNYSDCFGSFWKSIPHFLNLGVFGKAIHIYHDSPLTILWYLISLTTNSNSHL